MGWNSSYLGGNVVSSYLHIDNLRTDLVTGKFWDAVGGTKYTRVLHDNTCGVVSTNSGYLALKPATGAVAIYDAAGTTKYTTVEHDGTDALISTNHGNLRLQSAAAKTQFYDDDGSMYLQLHMDGTDAHATLSSGNLYLDVTNAALGCSSAYFNVDISGSVRIRNSNTNKLYFGGTGAADTYGALYTSGTQLIAEFSQLIPAAGSGASLGDGGAGGSRWALAATTINANNLALSATPGTPIHIDASGNLFKYTG